MPAPAPALRPPPLLQAYAVGANFQGSDMTNAVVDRVAFDNANLRDVKFINTVVTGEARRPHGHACAHASHASSQSAAA